MGADFDDVGPDEAFRLIRAYSRRRGTRIADLTAAIVSDPANVADLTASA
ncbi:ANTAR domain-containing protein [Nucisporomicrobium flavum]